MSEWPVPDQSLLRTQGATPYGRVLPGSLQAECSKADVRPGLALARGTDDKREQVPTGGAVLDSAITTVAIRPSVHSLAPALEQGRQSRPRRGLRLHRYGQAEVAMTAHTERLLSSRKPTSSNRPAGPS